MSPNLALFILRILAALLLYAFLAAAVWIVWRDLRAAAAQAAARQRAVGRLVVLDGAGADASPGAAHALWPLTSIGRAPTNTLALSDEAVSLEHALITLRAGQWWLEDLGSRNGTTLNDVRVDGPVVLSAGDVIGVGHVRLKLELE